MPNHLFPYTWKLSDGFPSKNIQYHGSKVFGTFICGGGSTMGYKLAGYNHLGGVEIDPPIAKVYEANHKPNYLYNQDIREFVKRTDFPKELFNLEILDGSPPCSSFSMSGNREKDWGKEKVFKEGQAKQVLDDLFFDYIALAKKLQPKVVIAENVTGLVKGNAKNYVHKIKEKFIDANYQVQLFQLNAATMGVPQKRERVFFICQRNDLKLPKLTLNFKEKAIPYREFKSEGKARRLSDEMITKWWNHRIPTDKKFEEIVYRLTGKKYQLFNRTIQNENDVISTIASSDGSWIVRYDKPEEICELDIIKAGTFPIDYNFLNIKPRYLIGMSVPPVMTAQISNQVYQQWLSKL